MSRSRAVIVGSTVVLGIALVSLALAPPRARPLARSPPSPPSLAEGPYSSSIEENAIGRLALTDAGLAAP